MSFAYDKIVNFECRGGFSGHSVWLLLLSWWMWLSCRPISVRGNTIGCPCSLGIRYKYRALSRRSSLDTAPVTGSHLFVATERCLTAPSTADLDLCVSRSWTVCFLLAVCRALRSSQQLRSNCVMAAGGGTPDDARSGISFGVTLQVPWNAPEAYVQLDLAGLSDLVTLPDALGMTGRHPDDII